ncbi:amidohydrolase [Embleya sp. NBC_00888]|uniref:amidohydrolase n=1 Tax=Embleya sp. NBC_00888 TaxID=2975960 RepID=UPI00386CCDD4|nr:amidohydrolase [Embleya sp. NBC_00888]
MGNLPTGPDEVSPGLAELYRDLHAHPELSFHEHRTANVIAERLDAAWTVTRGVGGTGVVAVLRNGDGPTVWMRADMDALPVREATGLDYASTVTTADGVPVMHACGHDVHVTCLLGACRVLATHLDTWHGTVVALFQPAEEIGRGARAMLDDGLLERFPRPDVVLGQHVAPGPAGMLAHCPGTVLAAADSLTIRLHGRGGHGSQPEHAVDPVVMAASLVMRLQTVVSRTVGPMEQAVVTVGRLQAGTKDNIIPAEAELGVNVRSFDEGVRARVLAAIERLTVAEAQGAGAPREPEIETTHNFPLTVNDAAETERVRAAHAAALGEERVRIMGPASASEDFGLFATEAGVPSVFWMFGGDDPADFGPDGPSRPVVANHSPYFAPVIEPTIETGVRALLIAAGAWLG